MFRYVGFRLCGLISRTGYLSIHLQTEWPITDAMTSVMKMMSTKIACHENTTRDLKT